MSILSQHINFVKEHIAIQDRLAKRYSKDEKRSLMHLQSKEGFSKLLEALLSADVALDEASKAVSTPGKGSVILTLRPDELEGLPKELLEELSEGAVPDKGEAAIINAINERGGIATLDQIMVGIYKALNEVIKRTTLTSKLYRMTQKGTIFPVPVRKGVYSTKRLNDDELRELFTSEDLQQQPLI